MRTARIGIPVSLGLVGLTLVALGSLGACGSGASKSTSSSGSTSSSSGGTGGDASTSHASTGAGTGGIPAGETSCAMVWTAALVDGGMGFVTSWVSADFPNNADWMAYEAINACACGNNMINGGCMDSCTFTAAGNPDFCFGASGDATCFDCLMSTCQTEIAACEAN